MRRRQSHVVGSGRLACVGRHNVGVKTRFTAHFALKFGFLEAFNSRIARGNQGL
jgi:hypothetical protein